MNEGRRARTLRQVAGIGLALGLAVGTAHAGDMTATTVSTTPAGPAEAPMDAPMGTSMNAPAAAPVESPMQAALSPGVVEGLKHLFARDYSGAVDRLSAAAQADPRDPAAHYYLGYTYYRMGDFGQARTAFAEAYRLDPHFSPEPKAP
jgi:TolA-binding protein